MNAKLRECAKCKWPLPPQAKFCKHCGAEAHVVEPLLLTAINWLLKRWKYSVVAVCLLLVVGVVLLPVGGPKPQGISPDGHVSPVPPPPDTGTKVLPPPPPPPPDSGGWEAKVLKDATQAISTPRRMAKHIGPLFDLLRRGASSSRRQAKDLLLRLANNRSQLDRLGRANLQRLSDGLAASGDSELVAAGQRLREQQPTAQPKGKGTLNTADTADLVKIDGEVVPGRTSPASIPLPAGEHTVQLFRTRDGSKPFRTETVTIRPNAVTTISLSN